jgi:hypothetical protein
MESLTRQEMPLFTMLSTSRPVAIGRRNVAEDNHQIRVKDPKTQHMVVENFDFFVTKHAGAETSDRLKDAPFVSIPWCRAEERRLLPALPNQRKV